MKKIIIIFLSFHFLIFFGKEDKSISKMIVCKKAANLSGIPQKQSRIQLPSSIKTNPHQISQLLFNEPVLIKKEYIDKKGKKWFLVEAIEQKNKYNHTWSGALGWVIDENLCPVDSFEQHNLIVKKLIAPVYNSKGKEIKSFYIGTKLTGTCAPEKNMYKVKLDTKQYGWMKADTINDITNQHNLPEKKIREDIVHTAEQFLGQLYSWGGRTPQVQELTVSSVDCSGLINLIFRANGFDIPRNSSSQYAFAHKIKHGKNLQPGDLIFFANLNHKISHVLLYAGNDMVIEASLTAEIVRKISFKKRIGKNLSSMKSGELSGPIKTADSNEPTFFKIYFASILKK